MTTLDFYPETLPADYETAPPEEARPSKKHGFLAAGFLLVLTAFLFPFKFASPYVATLVIGLVGALGIFLAVCIKQRWKLHFTSESIFLFGTTVSFVAAPVLARILSNDFNDWSASPERRLAKDGYAGALLLILFFISIFLFASSFFHEKRAPRFDDGRLAAAFSPRTFIVFFGLAWMLWSVRFALLASGSYYTIHRSQFQFQDARYSGWAQMDNAGPIILAFLWGAVWMGKARVWWVLAYTGVDFMWNFMSGGRQRTLLVVIAILVTFIVYRRRIPWKAILVGVPAALVLLGFMDFYRYALRQYADVDRIDMNSIVNALTRAQVDSEKVGLWNTLEVGAARLNDLDSVAAISLWVPDQQPYLKGETYERIIPALIPRFMWPDKPVVVTPINEWFFRNEGGSSGTTVIGEGFLNFGMLGVIAAAIIVSLIIRLLDGIVVGWMWNSAMLPCYVGILSQIMFMQGHTLNVWITSVIKMITLAVIVHMLTFPRRDQPIFHPSDPRGRDPELGMEALA